MLCDRRQIADTVVLSRMNKIRPAPYLTLSKLGSGYVLVAEPTRELNAGPGKGKGVSPIIMFHR